MAGISFSAGTSKNDNSENSFFTDNSVRYLLIPLKNLTVTSNPPTNGPNDNQFYVTSFNQLFAREMQINKLSYVIDSLDEFNELMLNSSDSLQNTEIEIIALLKKFNCDRIVYAATCSLQQTIVQNEGWRHNRSGPSYERPVQTIVFARLHFKVVNSEGKKIIESDIKGKCKKPFMYSFFKRFSKNSDIRNYARSLYAPPEIKALYSVITKIFMLQTSER